MDKPIAMPKFRPAPVTEKHIQTAFSIVQRRENIRRGQYRSLPDEDEPTRVAYRASFGIHPHNAGCNRYMTVVPYDWSRVILPPPSSSQSDGTSNSSPYSGITGNSYINASWVRELSGGKWTVATQAPLERTAHAFLSMLLLLVSPPQSEPTSTTRDSSVTPPPMANQLRTIVQLTPYMEGKAKKAFQYFPQEIGQELIWQPEMRASHPSTDEGSNTGVEILHHPSISVTLLDAIPSKHEEPIWVQSILKVSFVGSPEPGHIVRHLHYLAWPDHGVPTDIQSLLQFMQYVDACNNDPSHLDYDDNPDPPLIIGCSAGVGRTGTYITLASLFRGYGLNKPKEPIVVEKVGGLNDEAGNSARGSREKANWNGVTLKSSPLGPLPQGLVEDEIASEVDRLRDQRPQMVYTIDQLRFIYKTLAATMELEEQTDA